VLTVLKRWSTSIVLIAILFLAFALRISKLTFQSLRNDEHFSRYTSSFQSIRDVIVEGGVLDKHPPGYAVFLHYWMRIFGDSEWIVRLPSVIAGVLAVYAFYRFARAIVSERVGLIAAGLMTVAHMPIYFSQDSRSYIFVLLFVIWSAHGLVRLAQTHVEGRSQHWRRILVMITLSVTSYLHYFGLLFVALAGIGAILPVIKKRLSISDWTIPFLGSALLYVPWLTAVVTHATERSSWMKEPSERLVENVTKQLASGTPNSWYAVIAVAIALAAYDRYRERKQAKDAHKLQEQLSTVVLIAVLVAWIILPFIAAVGVSYAIIPVISARNMIIVEPAVFLLIALALDKIDKRLLRGFPIVATLAVGYLLYHTIFVEKYYKKITKRHYRAVAAYLEKRVGEEPHPAFIVTESNWDNWLNYYWESRPYRAEAHDGIGRQLRVSATTRNVENEIELKQPESIWFVINPTKGMTRLPQTLLNYKLDYTSKFVGISLKHFVRTKELGQND
jgi:uncharacterized membrane protein